MTGTDLNVSSDRESLRHAAVVAKFQDLNKR